MRWFYIVPRLLIVVLLWSFLTWGLDPLLKYSAVQSIQVVTGAKADLTGFSTTLNPPGFRIQGAAFASASEPGFNLMQFDELSLQLAGDPLLRRQFVVTEGRLSGVRFRTARADDGQLPVTPEPPSDQQPSWLAEQLKSIGDEWLTKLTDDVKSHLDPNTLLTYRVGSEIHLKWEDRLNSISDRSRLMQPRWQQLKMQFENAKRGDPIQQLEQYLQLARQAELLTQEAQKIRVELTGIVPEVRDDFSRLNQARHTDEQMIRQKLELLKPDSRRISESLIGEQMYRQLQQLLSWIELGQQYQQELKQQTQPTRGRGTDFQFPILNPTPDFVLEKLLVSGEMMLDGTPVPFEAVLTDVTEDAPLLARPCILRLKSNGAKPLLVQITYDATRRVSETQILASWQNAEGAVLRAGQQKHAEVAVRTAAIDWQLNLNIAAQKLRGEVRLHSGLHDTMFVVNESIRPEIVQAARDVLGSIDRVDACLEIDGTLRKPQIRLDSNLGPAIGDGLRTAFNAQLQNAGNRLSSEINDYASDQIIRLKTRFAGQYDQLLKENSTLIAQIQEVQNIVAAVQSGRVDPNTVFRQVTDSKLLPEKQQQSINRAMQDANKILKPNNLPIRLPGLSALGGESSAPADR